MRVLVTGGGGYIGSLVVEELLQRGHRPVVFDLFNWGRSPIEAFGDSIDIFEGDCRSSKDIIYALEDIDAIVHLAGIVGEPACKINPKAHFTINVESTRTLIDCCTDPEAGLVRDFVFASSCSVYGNVKGLFEEVTESTPTAPLSAYAHAKLTSEQIIFEKARQVPHFHPTVLRLTTIFGWAHRPRLDLVTNLFAYNAWKNGKITIFGDGLQYRSLIHVRDVARAMVQVLDAPRFVRDGKIFHVGEEQNNKTVKEIAEIVKTRLPQTEIELNPGEPTDRRDYRINCQKLKNVIGWKARYSVEDGINELVEKFESMDLDWTSWQYRNNNFQYV